MFNFRNPKNGPVSHPFGRRMEEKALDQIRKALISLPTSSRIAVLQKINSEFLG